MIRHRIFVLGHRGMLGHTVARYLAERGHELVTSSRRYSGRAKDELLQEVNASDCNWVINAIGLIPQKSRDDDQLLRINAVLPLHLLQELGESQRVIHPSTDCVFSGRKGNYQPGEHKDSEDTYGLSKALGEQIQRDPRVLVMRTSIIGPDLGSSAGLLGWFLKQEGEVNGYTNHFWNGITTLEWAKAAEEVIRGAAPVSQGVVQLGTRDRHSKNEMLHLFAEVWNRTVTIHPLATAETIDRTLHPEWTRGGLYDQLLELKTWMDHPPPAAE